MPATQRLNADQVMSSAGWLPLMPEAFRADVLRRSVLKSYAPGEAVFRIGDPPGGIFGLVSGCLSVNSAAPHAAPQPVHIGEPGAWTGEGCFLTGQPRRGEMRALTHVQMLHLPLAAMEEMAAADPAAIRAFGTIAVLTVDVLIRIAHDLQIRNIDRRVASVLVRLSGAAGAAIPLSQADIGSMANASRKRVNTALQRFAEAGWLDKQNAYRSVSITDFPALRAFAGDDSHD